MKKREIINNEYYHVYNRGARKNTIFDDDLDYQRFIETLTWYQKYAYPYSAYLKQLNSPQVSKNELDQHIAQNYSNPALINILSFALMPNHFHLVIRQHHENGIRRYLKLITTSHAMYFNRRYSFSGAVFQGRYQTVHIANEYQLLHTCRYVHLNPV